MLITIESKSVEIIVGGDLSDLMVEFVGTGKGGALAGNDDERIAAAGDFTAALPRGDIGFVPGRVDVEAIFSGALDLEGGIGSINLEVVFIVKMAHAYND